MAKLYPHADTRAGGLHVCDGEGVGEGEVDTVAIGSKGFDVLFVKFIGSQRCACVNTPKSSEEN
ncbi:hypothetical protein E2C01_031183 [Portunus trituberculatus]|uniref:Uncharacterized protein n=1 Tax=Portunus trituberculatus TaxID=210409 RepID=A0A5B7EZE0_PORTR|nr:hypothetical protein [Portunus trituberculatus]